MLLSQLAANVDYLLAIYRSLDIASEARNYNPTLSGNGVSLSGTVPGNTN